MPGAGLIGLAYELGLAVPEIEICASGDGE